MGSMAAGMRAEALIGVLSQLKTVSSRMGLTMPMLSRVGIQLELGVLAQDVTLCALTST